jgi:hypothetical protein
MAKKSKTPPKPVLKVATTHAWTAAKLAEMPADRLQGLRDRSVRLAAPDLTLLCDAELGARADRLAQAKAAAPARKRRTSVVLEYHFVCAGDRGVTSETDGTFRTGSWIVAQEQVDASLKGGALVALHEARDLPSYRQGTILGYQVSAPDAFDKDNRRIEFHVQPTPEALAWAGNGVGEKGYRWSDA